MKLNIKFIILRFLKFLFYYPNEKNLRNLISDMLSNKLGFFKKILYLIHIREISNLILAEDIYLNSKYDDPNIDSKIINKYIHEFESLICNIKYEPAGMINTSLVVLYSLIREIKPRIFIESGSKYGYSSNIIAEAIKKNNTKSKFYCLSIFNNDEKKYFKNKMDKYNFVEIIEGKSEENISKILEKNRNEKFAILIDGPKGRSTGWDILNKTILKYNKNIQFLAFDSAQEHLPYEIFYKNWNNKRSINIERLKITTLFKNHYQNIDFNISFQSNQFCRKYWHLNKNVLDERNKKKGVDQIWSEYNFDKINNHISICYKLGLIYKKKLF